MCVFESYCLQEDKKKKSGDSNSQAACAFKSTPFFLSISQ